MIVSFLHNIVWEILVVDAKCLVANFDDPSTFIIMSIEVLKSLKVFHLVFE